MITMLLDNNLDNIKIYDAAGVDRIFVDLEINGKQARQGHLDTVISTHSLADIKRIKPILRNSDLLVRVNPMHHDSAQEINHVIENGADIIMLPMFKTVAEVQNFIALVNQRAQTCLLLETAEALARLDDILDVEGIDEVHIGLNDLHLSLGLDFMFELMGDGLVGYIADKLKVRGIPFGVGGIARMDEGLLPGYVVLTEHIRLGSTRVILSRTFKRGLDVDKSVIKTELQKLREVEQKALQMSNEALQANHNELKRLAKAIASMMREKKHAV